MLKACITTRPRSEEHADMMHVGLARVGVTITDADSADFLVTWGERSRRKLTRYGKPILVMERAYLGDRFDWMSIGWDGLNGNANFCNEDVPDDRWRRLWRDQMQPITRGDGALIIGQVNGDASLGGIDCEKWARDVRRGLGSMGIDSTYRPHPQSASRRPPTAADHASLAEQMAACDFVVTYSSNAGVLAAMAGKRVTAESDVSMIWDIAGHGWQDDKMLLDRDDWGRKLAYCQWTPEEVKRGDFWDTLKRRLEQ